MDTEKMVTDILINFINAFLVPLVIPIFTLVLNKEKSMNARTDTAKVHLVSGFMKRIKIATDIDDKITFRNELPSVYFGNLIWTAIYMYDSNFRTPFIIICYVAIVLCMIFMIFVTRNYSDELKEIMLKITGIILALFSICIALFPLYSKFDIERLLKIFARVV